MIEQTVILGGMERQILTAEKANDVQTLEHYVHNLIERGAELTLDIETNARSMYGGRFEVRLVQFGTMSEAFIFPVEKKWGGRHKVARILNEAPTLIAHNAKYDVLGLEVAGFLRDAALLEGRFVDTRLLTHLLDPRGREHGGIGQALKDVVNHYVDPEFKDSAKELKAHFKTLFGKQCTIAEGFRRIDLFDPVYLEYAGLDVIGTALLFDVIAPVVKSQQS